MVHEGLNREASYSLGDLSPYGLASSVFYDVVLSSKEQVHLRYHRVFSMVEMDIFLAQFSDAIDGYKVSVHFNDKKYHDMLLISGDNLIKLTIGSPRNHYDCTIASSDPEEADRILAIVQALLPVAEVKRSDVIEVYFWGLGKRGPITHRRELAAPNWDEIQGNYTSKTAGGMEKLIGLETGQGSGQLILLYGPPGTGKSFAIRGLAKEWSNWCAIHYILDPEKFLNEAEYMVAVALDSPDGMEEPSLGFLSEDPDQPGTKLKWQLIIIEDADEFLTVDAKERSRQGFSRLLNLVDGFIGQGMRLLILITTNEPIEHVHPAISRPGRCLANIEFSKFPRDEASDWLKAHGQNRLAVGESMTLAELYSQSQIKTATTPLSIGFRK